MENESGKIIPEKRRNYLRDQVHLALKLGEVTKVPMLLISNPGLGKTSMFRSWCKKEGYELTTLIGSQRTAEEVLGYMVNNGSKLITYTPDWFDEIWENSKAGKKTALFLDELSTAPENVQGAMLQLIFDRKVGGRGNFLPEDCLVIAAANYKTNLPPQNSMMAPTLNRFCIVNLEPLDAISLSEEFLQSPEEMEEDMVVFHDNVITAKMEADLRANIKQVLGLAFNTYAKNDGVDSTISMQNHDFNEMYDQKGMIYNFVSGRTISYLYRLCRGIMQLGLLKKRYEAAVVNMVFGLVGLGTNSFEDEKKKADWETAMSRGIRKALRHTYQNNQDTIEKTKLDFTNLSVANAINKWTNYSESNPLYDDNFKALFSMIDNNYSPAADAMMKVISGIDSTKKAHEFLDDVNKIKSLVGTLGTVEISEIKDYIKKLNVIIAAYDGYSSQIMLNIVNG